MTTNGTTDEHRELTGPVTTRDLPIHEIGKDPLYQRGKESNSDQIADDFLREALGTLIVGERIDGSLWVVDGLQRLLAVRKRGDRDTIKAEVFPSRGPEHEALVFRYINSPKNRKNLKPRDLFRAMLAEGNETAWTIKKEVERVGFSLSLSVGGSSKLLDASRVIGCINEIWKVVNNPKHGGLPGLTFAMRVIGSTWMDDREATSFAVLGGLATFYANRGGKVDEGRLVARLQSRSPGQLKYAINKAKKNNLTNFGIEVYGAEVIDALYRKRK